MAENALEMDASSRNTEEKQRDLQRRFEIATRQLEEQRKRAAEAGRENKARVDRVLAKYRDAWRPAVEMVLADRLDLYVTIHSCLATFRYTEREMREIRRRFQRGEMAAVPIVETLADWEHCFGKYKLYFKELFNNEYPETVAALDVYMAIVLHKAETHIEPAVVAFAMAWLNEILRGGHLLAACWTTPSPWHVQVFFSRETELGYEDWLRDQARARRRQRHTQRRNRQRRFAKILRRLPSPHRAGP